MHRGCTHGIGAPSERLKPAGSSEGNFDIEVVDSTNIDTSTIHFLSQLGMPLGDSWLEASVVTRKRNASGGHPWGSFISGCFPSPFHSCHR